MAKIPTYTAQGQLDPASRFMPRANMDTSPQSAQMAGAQQLSQLGRSVGQVGEAIAGFQAHLQKKQEQQAEFGLRVAEDRTIEALNSDLMEYQQKMPENGAGFAEGFMQNVNKRKEEFFANVRPEQRAEYEMRWQQRVAGSFGRKVAELEAKQTSEYAELQVNKFHDIAKGAVAQDPAQFDLNAKELIDRIDKAPAPWTPFQRSEMKRQGLSSLAEIAVKAKGGHSVEEMQRLTGMKIIAPDAPRREGGPRDRYMPTGTGDPVARGIPPSGIGPGGQPVVQKAVSIIAGHEGFRTGTYADMTIRNGQRVNSGYRLGFGSDTITKADGTVIRVQQGMTVSRADAERDLARRTNIELNRARSVIGEGFDRLHGDAQAAIASVGYNYGKVPNVLRVAAATGDPEKVARAIEALRFDNGGINARRRQQEADLARGKSSVPSDAKVGRFGLSGVEAGAPQIQVREDPDVKPDPAAAHLSYEQKVKLINGARATEERAIRVAEANAVREAAEAESLRQAQVGEMKIRAHHGDLTMVEAQEALSNGMFKPDEYLGIARAIEGRDKGIQLAAQTEASIEAGRIPHGTDGKKALGALEERNGEIEALQQMDPQKVAGLVHRFGKVGLVSDDAEGSLAAMIRSPDKRMVEFAMTTLDQMHKANPVGFDQNMKQLTPMLERWRGFLDSGRPDAFYQSVRRSLEPSNVVEDKQRREVAREQVKNMQDADLLNIFDDAWFSDPQAPVDAAGSNVTGVLREDYRRLYEEAFAVSNSPDVAKKEADAQIKQIWQVSHAAGGRLMRHAPETMLGVMGLPAGETGWMREQVVGIVREQLMAKGVVKEDDAGAAPRQGVGTRAIMGLAGVALPKVGNMPDDITLIATPRTRTEIEVLRAKGELPGGRKSPTYFIGYTDPVTGTPTLLMNERTGQPANFAFDPEPVRTKLDAEWEAKRQKDQETRARVEEQNATRRRNPFANTTIRMREGAGAPGLRE